MRMFHVKHKSEERELKTNDVLDLAVTGYTSDGEGVARSNGEVVFIPGAIAGETVRARIVNVGKTCAHGKIEKILSASLHRVKPACPDFPDCGGCDFWHMDYEEERRLKRQRVIDALARIGGVEIAELPMHGAPRCEGYRNKVQFPVAAQNGRAVAGFFRARTHEVIPVQSCRIQPECAGRVRAAVLSWMEQYRIRAYDERSHTGYIRHIYLRVGEKTGQLLVCVVANCENLPKKTQLCQTLLAAEPDITSIVVSYNTKRGNTVLGPREEVLHGPGQIEDELLGLRFRLSARSFYQVNHDQAERLYEKALEFAALDKTQTALDLYCGTGTITLCLARKAGKAIGVEVVDAAILDAKQNAARNGIENVEFFCADASEAAKRFAASAIRPDVIVVDPPRKGVSLDVVEAMTQMSPARIVYVSCDPATLARDIRLLTQRGYRFETAEAFDLFPRCAHVETVCLLVRRNSLHIDIDVDVEEMLQEKRGQATYPQIKEYVLEHSGLKVSNLYIAQVKQKCGIIERENYNKPKSQEAKQPQCPPDKEKAIKEALRHFGMI